MTCPTCQAELSLVLGKYLIEGHTFEMARRRSEPVMWAFVIYQGERLENFNYRCGRCQGALSFFAHLVECPSETARLRQRGVVELYESKEALMEALL